MHGLNPEAASYLSRLASGGGQPIHLGTPQQARDRHEATSADAWPGEFDPVAASSDETLGGVAVRIVDPVGTIEPGVVLFAHGGGWVTGTKDSYEQLSRSLAHGLRRRVVFIDYELAPEAQHPAQVLQVLAAWAAASQRWGTPLALVGDSAGAYLVLAAAELAPYLGLDTAGIAVLYPVVDPALDTPSAERLATGYRLTTEAMRWYWGHYLREGVTPRSLLDTEELAALPPTFVLTAGFDPLHDEGCALVEALRRAGVATTHVDVSDQIHGFLRVETLRDSGQKALSQLSEFIDNLPGGRE